MRWFEKAYFEDYSKNAADREKARKKFLKEEKKNTIKAQKLYKWTIKL